MSDGYSFIENCQIDEATGVISRLRANAVFAARLHALPDEEYYQPVIAKLELLKERAKRQLEILQQLNELERIPEKSLTVADLERAKQLVADARSMDDFVHPTIDTCDELVGSYARALRAVDSPDGVKNMSAVDMAQSIAALHRFEHVLPSRAASIITQANAYIESIKAEMEEYLPKITAALLKYPLSVNAETGQLDGDITPAALMESIVNITEESLVSYECRRMHSLCKLSIQLRTLKSWGKDAELVELLRKVWASLFTRHSVQLPHMCSFIIFLLLLLLLPCVSFRSRPREDCSRDPSSRPTAHRRADRLRPPPPPQPQPQQEALQWCPLSVRPRGRPSGACR